jgi:uncharacterized protein
MLAQEIHTKINIPDGGYLAANIIKPNQGGSLPAVIFLTGSSKTKESFQDIQYWFSNKGYYTLAFDFRGRGESSGQPGENTLRNQQYDLKHTMSFITYHQPIDTIEISILGTSMGAFVAASIADEIPIKNLILSAPAMYLPEHESVPQMQLDGKAAQIAVENKDKVDKSTSLQHLKKFMGNLLVLEHEQDDIIPSWLCQQYYSVAVNTISKDYQQLKGIKHQVLIDSDWRRQLAEVIYSWFLALNQSLSPTPLSV